MVFRIILFPCKTCQIPVRWLVLPILTIFFFNQLRAANFSLPLFLKKLHFKLKLNCVILQHQRRLECVSPAEEVSRVPGIFLQQEDPFEGWGPIEPQPIQQQARASSQGAASCVVQTIGLSCEKASTPTAKEASASQTASGGCCGSN